MVINFEAALRRHLDLGCGASPRNVYGRPELFGIDIRSNPLIDGLVFRQANLSIDPIPFPDNYFGSVSAFDYLEHVPRILATHDGKSTTFPFVCLMSEIWRVLAPNGLLYALTPAYPSPQAFQDPTHVNVITAQTHEYFCGDFPVAAMYGFLGRFKAINTGFVVHKDSRIHAEKTIRKKIRHLKYRLQGRLTHFLWELEAIK